MKTLILVRHGKAEEAVLGGSDFERRLNPRGQSDAITMGKRLQQRGLIPDRILSSASRRTVETTRFIAMELHFPLEEVEWEAELYHASPSALLHAIQCCSPQVQTLMIVAHNNGLTDFANALCGTFTDNIPTCGMVVCTMEENDWTDFETAKKTMALYDYPKRFFA